MKLKFLAATLALAASATVSAAPTGESSNYNTIDTREASTAIPFGEGKASLKINNSSININIGNGPVKHINKKYSNKPINGTDINGTANGLANPTYLTVKDVNPVIGLFTNPTLGQVWYEKRAANVDVYSVRQITDVKLPVAPKFGGLVIGQVKNLPDGSGVYFGEWAPRASGTPVQNSTNLNMNDASRTVWYAGDNPTGSTKGLATATYDVVGINKHTPGANDFYRGTVTAKFGTTAQGTMAGQIARGADKVSFDKAKIDNNKGMFADTNQGMKGQFYGKGAAAMAGITTRGSTSTSDDVAFGGRKR